MRKTDNFQIPKSISTYLFLSNLKPDTSNDDKIEDLILSLNKVIKNNRNDKLTHLNTLEYRLRHIRFRNIISRIEEEREIKRVY